MSARCDPYAVTEEIVAILKQYHITTVYGDGYASKWVAEAFAKAGITYIKTKEDKNIIYLNVLPLFSAGLVRLVDNQRIVLQFAQLERRVYPTRETVNHPQDGHDDVCNAVAGALVLASRVHYEQVIPMLAPFVVGKDGVVYSDPAANNGGRSAQPPAHYLKQNQGAEPWRDYVSADGYISMNCGGNRWGPI